MFVVYNNKVTVYSNSLLKSTRTRRFQAYLCYLSHKIRNVARFVRLGAKLASKVQRASSVINAKRYHCLALLIANDQPHRVVLTWDEFKISRNKSLR